MDKRMDPYTYKILRFYQNPDKETFVVKTGLSLEQAQAHCEDKETSSYTAIRPKGCENNPEKIERWHKLQKHWFDGYTRE